MFKFKDYLLIKENEEVATEQEFRQDALKYLPAPTQKHPAPKLKLQWEYKSNNFSSWLMSEVTKELAKELHAWLDENSDELPFHSLFKQKEDKSPITRVKIPFTIDPITLSILDKLKDLNVNFKTGTALIGKQQVRLGKYVLSKKSPFSEEEKDWWNHAGNAVVELENAKRSDQHTIIVSRNPIDIARMSDHDGWTSCHSPHREYFKCAIADAKGAGAIAYVVKNEDLDKIDLETPEIFKDKKRSNSWIGIVPISRVRLRKFVHKKDGYDLAVPEKRTYGAKFPGLEDSVRDWALINQQDKLKGTRPHMKDFNLMGGSYQDTQGSELFNFMFNDRLDSGDADYGGEDEYQGMVDQMEEEVARIERTYANKFTICSFWASVEDNDEHPYVSYSGSVQLSIPVELSTNGPNTLGDRDAPDYWEKTRKIRDAVRKWAHDNGIYSVNDIEINGNTVRIDIYDEGGNMEPDAFESFLSNDLTDIDKRKDELEASLYHLFIDLGLARENKIASISSDLDSHPHQFQNFKWDEGDTPDVIVSLKNPIQLTNPKLSQSGGGYQHEYSYWQDQFKKLIIEELNKWADKFLVSQPSLFAGTEWERENPIKRPFSSEFKLQPTIEIKPKNSWQKANPNEPMFMFMNIDFKPFDKDEDVNDVLEFVEFLDKNYTRFASIAYSTYEKLSANWVHPEIKV